MNIERVVSLCLILVILIFGASSAYHTDVIIPTGIFGWSEWADKVAVSSLSGFKAEQHPAVELILGVNAGVMDGIFITDERVIKDIRPGPEEILKANVQGIEDFVAKNDILTAVMIIPTASAIKQSEIPITADIYNQREMIEKVFEQLSGKVTAVDVYAELFAAREQYTYYRTETNLTGLGGYYLYSVLAPRLGLNSRGLNDYEVTHIKTPYYGSLHEQSPIKSTVPDIIATYHFLESDSVVKATHHGDGGVKTYYDISPSHVENLKSPYDVIMGGYSPRIDITTATQYTKSMLIIGDETVLSYLTFLIPHYGDITFLDLSKLDDTHIADIDIDNYDNMMFAFSVDSMLNSLVCDNSGDLGQDKL